MTPSLIIVEAAEEHDKLLEKLESLADVCDEGTNLVILGTVNDVAMYREITQRGVSDYLVPPFNAPQVFETVAAVCIDPTEVPRGQLIAFMGAEGGTGSSTIAHNTAWCLSRSFDKEVAVIDLDLAFGTLGLAFNLESAQGIKDALEAPDRLDDVLLERFMAKPDEHLMLLTAPASLESDATINITALDTLLDMVCQKAPFVVLDVPHGWSSWRRHALTQADEIVLTSTLDLASFRDTKNLIDTLGAKRLNDAPIRLVLNHDGAFKRSQLSAKDFEKEIGLAPALVVPHEPALFGAAANSGQMIGDVNKKHKVVVGFNKLAQTVSGREPLMTGKKKKKGGLFKGRKG